MTPRQRRNLERLLAPRTIAFIGGEAAAFAARQCAEAGFDGEIWGVNPHRAELGGQPCFPSVKDLPGGPDAVFLAVPRDAAVETVAAFRDIDAGGIVSFTAGFGETGEEGVERERRLVEAAGEVALVGPNCSGILNFVCNAPLWPFSFGGSPTRRGIAFVTQSGMLGNTVTLNERTIPFAYIISAGNQAMLGIEDFLEVLVDDSAVSAIGLYVEGLRDIGRFAEAAIRALEAGVPIVVLKAGTSEIGSRLTATHTGTLSGTDELYQALFERLGIVRVTSPVALLETLKMLTVAGAPKGNRFAALTCSGGDSTMLADSAERLGIAFPQPSPGVAAALAEQLPPIATVTNPLDYTTPLWGHEEQVRRLCATMFSDGYDAAVLVQDYPPAAGDSQEPYHADARAFIAAAKEAGIPAAICTGLPETIDRQTRERLVAAGAAPLQGLEEGLSAMAEAARYGAFQSAFAPSRDGAGLAIRPVPPLAGEAAALDEWEGKRRLAEAGVAVPEGRLVAAADAAAAAVEIGFPVALKMVSARLPHKTEAGAVKLGLDSPGAVDDAVAAIRDAVGAYAPQAATGDFLVERMVTGVVAELLVGVRRDDQFGQVMVLASGGTLVELVGDSRVLLLPADRASVEAALASLKVSAVIDGFRGAAAGDREALVDTVLAIARFADSERDRLSELDVNPLMVLGEGEGAVAVDVLLRAVPSAAGR